MDVKEATGALGQAPSVQLEIQGWDILVTTEWGAICFCI